MAAAARGPAHAAAVSPFVLRRLHRLAALMLCLLSLARYRPRIAEAATSAAATSAAAGSAAAAPSSNPARRRAAAWISAGFVSAAPPAAAWRSRSVSTSSSTALGMGRGGGGGGKGADKDKISKGRKKGDLPEKVCEVCGRPFTWRKKWEKVWDEVKYCSDRCRNQRGSKGGGGGGGSGEGGGESATRRSSSSISSVDAAVGLGPLSRRRFSTGLAASLVGAALGTAAVGSGPSPPQQHRSPSWLPSAAGAATEGPLRPKPGEIERLLQAPEEELWPDAEAPYTREDFRRLDESDDARFYDEPKLVEHIDPPAVRALERYYAQALPALAQAMYGDRQRRLDVLDLGASWVSHLPAEYTGNAAASRVAGLGMNAAELAQNKQLTESTVRDLNKTPTLPFPDASFDCVVCALSIDYFTQPLSVLGEVGRVLRPGGMVAIAFSNRLFIQKAVAVWTGKADEDHVLSVADFLHYSPGRRFDKPQARDLSPSPTQGDPLYVVYAFRSKDRP